MDKYERLEKVGEGQSHESTRSDARRTRKERASGTGKFTECVLKSKEKYLT